MLVFAFKDSRNKHLGPWFMKIKQYTPNQPWSYGRKQGTKWLELRTKLKGKAMKKTLPIWQ